MAWIGDGATSTGAFHEGMNFAAVQKLPLVVVAEDNKYAYSTPIAKQMAIARIDERAAAYGIPHEMVDGNDMLAVYDVAKRMVDRARAGEGASLIGVDTMRMQGHAQHDDARYVPKALLESGRRAIRSRAIRQALIDDGDRHASRTSRTSTTWPRTTSPRKRARPRTRRCRIRRRSPAASTPATTSPSRGSSS